MKVLRAGLMALALGFTLLLSGLQTAGAQVTEPPGGKFQKVSSLVELPDFIPGLGALYVDPSTLPAGPFLAYDHKGSLVSTIYMIPLQDITDHKAYSDLAAGKGLEVDHVELHYNAGHPGVTVPHYHLILWYISPEKAQALK